MCHRQIVVVVVVVVVIITIIMMMMMMMIIIIIMPILCLCKEILDVIFVNSLFPTPKSGRQVLS